jgi:hypothetical protein
LASGVSENVTADPARPASGSRSGKGPLGLDVLLEEAGAEVPREGDAMIFVTAALTNSTSGATWMIILDQFARPVSRTLLQTSWAGLSAGSAMANIEKLHDYYLVLELPGFVAGIEQAAPVRRSTASTFYPSVSCRYVRSNSRS